MQVSRKPHVGPDTRAIMGLTPTLSWQLLATWSHTAWAGHQHKHQRRAVRQVPSGPASTLMVCAHLGSIYWAGLFLRQSRVGWNGAWCLLSIFVRGSGPGAQEVETAWARSSGPVYLCAGRPPHTLPLHCSVVPVLSRCSLCPSLALSRMVRTADKPCGLQPPPTASDHKCEWRRG